ncbi:MAG: hypothetical protein JNG86_01460, partial [Verrucomicrobiaceae bacterium]|nr:hypothetical protein [Verrucomicrobiaceae bacterium]
MRVRASHRAAFMCLTAILLSGRQCPSAAHAVEEEPTGLTGTGGRVEVRCGHQKLIGRVSSDGLWLVSTEKPGGKAFRITAAAFGRGDILAELEKTGRVDASEKVARWIRRDLVEEYQVSPEGVRQDFVILERPAGTQPLHVALSLNGARAEAAEPGARLVLDDSGREIAYSRLRVVDAAGMECQARIEVAHAQAMRIVVEDASAVYPLRIDPTFSDADWVSMNPDRMGTDDIVFALAKDAAGNIYH